MTKREKYDLEANTSRNTTRYLERLNPVILNEKYIAR